MDELDETEQQDGLNENEEQESKMEDLNLMDVELAKDVGVEENKLNDAEMNED